ncbi:Ros/MucR family transcriptional regulator [Insolitispirillum peregrinum]|uniref:Transcriptional regulator, MucR family n=1 Tax=Insolitispirillum peregrinum TaxID=80876 RepID=A0A1N7IND8_9PROT|nr:MucR family transcriptional regulator [Insolitispirillum peregrinum]SIS38589.1 transcriptional regulator, MucR family [Insolitispirillum peregrinum]
MADTFSPTTTEDEKLRLAAKVVAAYVGQNTLPAQQIPDLIQSVYQAFQMVSAPEPEPVIEALKPAVPVKKSITPEYIICLEDGKKLKMLKRHLRTNYGMTPEEYRAKWNLPADYPMVAPNYAEQRSQFAKQIGLGRKGGE